MCALQEGGEGEGKKDGKIRDEARLPPTDTNNAGRVLYSKCGIVGHDSLCVCGPCMYTYSKHHLKGTHIKMIFFFKE